MADIPKRRTITDAWNAEAVWDFGSPLGTIIYSPQYSDDEYVFRHITVPHKILKKTKILLHHYYCELPRKPAWSDRLRNYPLASLDGSPLLPYTEIVSRLHIQMSSDWMLYMVHDRNMTLCFRRPRRDKSADT
eukprot:Gregarina_sp_Poly_1__4454@NODE_239_length_10907_cov_182_631458_g210_i0_p11_GENE_NODE_239_length_10907_cov_182_631458_g210_i0NODE_239_length_10907_cov_182_631458_g210_i0_p11_ORF_typecomplete_len133_score16_79CKS/PF01111_19/2_1e15_NODE_239_length_10907_cov_182_631458_g210_i0443841